MLTVERSIQSQRLRFPAAREADLEALPPSEGPTEIDLRGSSELRSIEFVRRFPNTRKISLRACSSLSSIEPVRSLSRLHRIDLTAAPVPDLSPLLDCPELTHLCYMAPRPVGWDHGVVRQLHSLTHLWLSGDPAARDLGFLIGAENIQFLDLGYCRMGDLKPLLELPHLTELELGYAGGVNLADLSSATGLRVLGLAGQAEIRDLAPLSGLQNLEVLVLDGCKGITDLSPLAGLKSLETLILLNCTGITDLAPLMKLPSLQGVSTSGSGVESLPDGFPEHLLID